MLPQDAETADYTADMESSNARNTLLELPVRSARITLSFV